MAIEYTLICFQGRTGATATMTIATPCVVTLSSNGSKNGTAVVFSTSGSLPTGITAGTTYYTRPIDTNTFHLYDTEAHAKATGSTTGRVNTSGSQSGTHTIWSSYWYNLSSSNRLRYGSAGSERVFKKAYDAISDRYNTIDKSVSLYIEVCDNFLDSFSDNTGTFKNNIATHRAYKITWTTLVNGSRSKGFHYGSVSDGYTFEYSGGVLEIARAYFVFDGLTISSSVKSVDNTVTILYFTSASRLCVVKNCIIQCPAGANNNGLYSYGVNNMIYNNLIYQCYRGYWIRSSGDKGSLIFNNTIVKCYSGFYAYDDGARISYGSFFNNVAYGCSNANWDTTPTDNSSYGIMYNAGISTDTPWGTSQVKTIVSGDFVDYTNNDFRLTSTSHLRDAGVNFDREFATVDSTDIPYDIINVFRPNYSAGAATDAWDIGCYEYDSGNGLAPISVTISIQNLVAQSSIFIKDTNNNTILSATQISGTSHSFTYTYTGDKTVNLYVRNRRNGYWIPFQMTGTITSSGANFYVSQVQDTNQ